jgi:hypothetical protein
MHFSLNLSGGIFNLKNEIPTFFSNFFLVFNASVPNPLYIYIIFKFLKKNSSPLFSSNNIKKNPLFTMIFIILEHVLAHTSFFFSFLLLLFFGEDQSIPRMKNLIILARRLW